jgi:hypothetical protein
MLDHVIPSHRPRWTNGISQYPAPSLGQVRNMMRYVKGHINELPRFVRRDLDLQQEISSEIIKTIDGMYVFLQHALNPANFLGFYLHNFTFIP